MQPNRFTAGLGIGMITEHYTGTGTGPVKSVAEQSITGSTYKYYCRLRCRYALLNYLT